VTLFQGVKDLLLSSGVGGSTKMPGITAGGIDNLLLSLPRDMQNLIDDNFCVKKKSNLAEQGIDIKALGRGSAPKESEHGKTLSFFAKPNNTV